MKTYLVQTWNKDGGLANHYEVSLANDRELADLRKFLKSKPGHVLITRIAEKRAAAPPKRR